MSENPFAAQTTPDNEQKFYLIPTPEWSWSLTDGDPPFYDRDFDGRLFVAEADCPFCHTEKGLWVVYSYAGVGASQPREWVCGCGLGGETVGRHGTGHLVPRDANDDEWVDLPFCVVIGG